MFDIRIAVDPDWANTDMVTVAKRNLGVCVPLPFYWGFPFLAYELSLEEIVLDEAEALLAIDQRRYAVC